MELFVTALLVRRSRELLSKDVISVRAQRSDKDSIADQRLVAEYHASTY